MILKGGWLHPLGAEEETDVGVSWAMASESVAKTVGRLPCDGDIPMRERVLMRQGFTREQIIQARTDDALYLRMIAAWVEKYQE